MSAHGSYESWFTGERHQVGDQVVLICEELPISGIGKTVDEATINLLKAFVTYSEGAKRIGQPGPLQHEHTAPGRFSYLLNHEPVASR